MISLYKTAKIGSFCNSARDQAFGYIEHWKDNWRVHLVSIILREFIYSVQNFSFFSVHVHVDKKEKVWNVKKIDEHTFFAL